MTRQRLDPLSARIGRGDPRLLSMSERELQASIEQLLDAVSWMYYHAPDNRPGPGGYVQNIKAGFPDLVIIDPGSRRRAGGPRTVALELKRQKDSNPTVDQMQWLAQFHRAGAYVAVIRPSHLVQIQDVIVRQQPWPAVDGVTLEPV